MEELQGKVVSRLRTEFDGLVDGLETTRTGRVMGAVVSPDFDGLDDKTRQDRIKQALKGLPPEDELRVGPIVALTPAEAEIDVSVDE